MTKYHTLEKSVQQNKIYVLIGSYTKRTILLAAAGLKNKKGHRDGTQFSPWFKKLFSTLFLMCVTHHPL